MDRKRETEKKRWRENRSHSETSTLVKRGARTAAAVAWSLSGGRVDCECWLPGTRDYLQVRRPRQSSDVRGGESRARAAVGSHAGQDEPPDERSALSREDARRRSARRPRWRTSPEVVSPFADRRPPRAHLRRYDNTHQRRPPPHAKSFGRRTRAIAAVIRVQRRPARALAQTVCCFISAFISHTGHTRFATGVFSIVMLSSTCFTEVFSFQRRRGPLVPGAHFLNRSSIVFPNPVRALLQRMCTRSCDTQ